ncbi:MAG: DHA2 family efflux MFS transporter permease subunit [bacterium]
MDRSASVNKWLITLTVMIPTFIEILDMTVVNVSLNHIQGSLSAGLDEVTWVLTSYLVSNAIVIPMSGWIASRIGRKRYLLISVTLFTGSSFLCGSATTLPMLVLFRVIQGIGGGGLQPLSQAILLETFPREQHGTAMAVYGMGIVFAPILGPILGGWITDNWTWRWIFYINVPIGVLSVSLILLFIHDPHYIRSVVRKIDYWGIALLVAGLGSLQVVLDRGERLDWMSSVFIVRLSIVAAVCLVLFVWRELRTDAPVVDLRVFKDRTFALGNLIMWSGFFAFFASLVLLPVYLQKLMNYTAWWAGLVLAPGGVATLLVMPITGKLLQKVDARKLLLIGLALNAYALHLMSRFSLEADFFTVMWPRIVQGLGLGCFFVPLSTVTVAYVSREKMGNATAVFSLLRNLGGSFGVAFLTTVLSRRTQFHHFRLAEMFAPTWPPFEISLDKLVPWMQTQLGGGRELGLRKAMALLYAELNRQAAMLGFNDAFYLDLFFFLLPIPLVFFMRRAARPGDGPLAH